MRCISEIPLNLVAMKIKLLTYVLLIVSLFSCEEDEKKISKEAEDYLNEVIDIMEANSINRYDIDWTDFRKKVFAVVPEARTIEDTYPGITEALVMLGDNHSFFLKPDGSSIFVGSLQCNGEAFVEPSVPENIGYVRVRHFWGSSNGADGIAFAIAIQDKIKEQDHAGITGWIVDLRGNGGGNMWPMLAGIGPILGDGTAGYFIDPDGHAKPWSYINGSTYLDTNKEITKLNYEYELITPNPKVAVLLDNAIGSSGEAIAISFVGRENTRSFGSPTCGLSTANSAFQLSNGAALYLTVSYMADRDKNLFGNPVQPDVASSSESIVEDAVEWLEN